MKIRAVRLADIDEVQRIYNESFKSNEYPECSFVVTDDDEKIIVAGGVKMLAELTVVSDQKQSVRIRQEALLQALGSAIIITKDMGHNQLHAFVNGNPEFAVHLQRYGFRPIDAKLLVLDFGES